MPTSQLSSISKKADSEKPAPVKHMDHKAFYATLDKETLAKMAIKLDEFEVEAKTELNFIRLRRSLLRKELDTRK